jgi:ATP-dependent DNA ligase
MHAHALILTRARATASSTQGFLLDSLQGQAEGLVIKYAESGGYEPGKRADAWLKLKKVCSNVLKFTGEIQDMRCREIKDKLSMQS